MSETPLEKFLARVRHRPSGNGYMAHCPTARHPNGDRHPSLKVDEGPEKQLLLSCHSHKCPSKEIMAAVGLTERDMFMDDQRGRMNGNGHAKRPPKIYPSAEDALNALQFVMKQRGEITGARIATYEYADAAGKLVGVVARFPTGVDASGRPTKTFRPVSAVDGGWAIKDPPVKWPLYRLNLLRSDGPVIVVEGEKCVHAAAGIGLNATTSQGGANGTGKTDWTPLRGREVWLLPDIGKPGEAWTHAIARILRALGCSVKIVRLPGIQNDGDDIVEFIELRRQDGKEDSAICQEIEALAAQARPDEQTQSEAKEPTDDFAGFVWAPVNATTFDAGDYRPTWRTERIVVDGQPLVIGAPLKTLKTGLMLDLAIAQASGLSFGNAFACPKAGRIAVLSGESGRHTIQETTRRICRAKNIKLADLGDNLRFLFTLPQLANVQHMTEFRRGIERDQVEVVYVDPLYLSLLSGGGNVKAENLYETGPLLLNIARACLDAGATPGLVHHTKKGAGRDGEPIDLTDLAFSGIGEFARQWILLSRRQKFDPSTGKHLLWMSVGGSVGHGSLHAVDIDEGFLQTDFSGRTWDVRVMAPMDCISEDKQQAADARRNAALEKAKKDDTEFLVTLDRLDPNGNGAGFERIVSNSELTKSRAKDAAARLIGERTIEEVEVTATVGKTAERPGVKGYRRIRDPVLFNSDREGGDS